MSEARVITGIEPCGCCRAVWVLGEHDADAYKDAAKWAKAGCDVRIMPIDEWKARGLYCDEHKATSGPPTWKRVRDAMKKADQPVLGL